MKIQRLLYTTLLLVIQTSITAFQTNNKLIKYNNYIELHQPTHAKQTFLVSDKNPTSLYLSPNTEIITTTSLLLSKEVEEWRQYVPLVVSCLVILDILLGSPLANIVIAPMRRQAIPDSDSDDEGTNPFSFTKTNSIETKKRERVDSDKFAQAALDKARNTKELREYLETRKTDRDRISEMKQKFDNQLEKIDIHD